MQKRKYQKTSKEDVQTFLNLRGCELVEYNCSDDLKYKCKCGRIVHNSWFNVRRSKFGHCQKCSTKERDQTGPKNPFWNPDRNKLKIDQKFSTACRNILKRVIRSEDKNNLTYNILGYDDKELSKWIQGHPNWLMVKDGDWHIDHIFPIKAFTEHGIYDVKLINCLENLQPLSKKENFIKRDFYDKAKFLEWLKQKGQDDRKSC